MPDTTERQGNSSRPKYESISKILTEDPQIATSVTSLILLGVPLVKCADFVMERSGKVVAPQSLRSEALKYPGKSGLYDALSQISLTLSLDERRSAFFEARAFATAHSPLTLWRTDPGIDYCIKDVIAEECTSTFTVTLKAKLIGDVLKDQGIVVPVSTIRKVLEEGGYKPEIRLLDLQVYSQNDLDKMREKALKVIVSSRKQRADNLVFEAPLWKNRELCIFLAEAISQGASIHALSIIARNSDYQFAPGSFQKFLQRNKREDGSIIMQENRASAATALKDLHGITNDELETVRPLVARFLEEYRLAVARDMARARELTQTTQAINGLEVFRNVVRNGLGTMFPQNMINFSVKERGGRPVLIVTSDPSNIAKMRNDYAAKIRSGVLKYGERHSIVDYDNMMYVLRGVASLKVIPPPGEYKNLLDALEVKAIEFHEVRPAVIEPNKPVSHSIPIEALSGGYNRFLLPPGAVINESQYVLRTKKGQLLRDGMLSEAPLRLGFRRVRDSDASYETEYAADIIDDTNTTVGTLVCVRAEEGLSEWLKQQGVASLEFVGNESWREKYHSEKIKQADTATSSPDK